MSQETWEILCEMEADDVELQLALQCAPLITGLKISNLLTISPEGFTQVGRIVESSVLSLYPLLETEEKMVILLYREDRLEKYLKMPQVQKLLREAGYESDRLEDILPVFCDRYETYAERGKPFPHELGLLLGYPRRMWKDLSDIRGRTASAPVIGKYMRIKKENRDFLKNMNMPGKI